MARTERALTLFSFRTRAPFLCGQDPETHLWYEMSDSVAREKFGQQLRENKVKKNTQKSQERRIQRQRQKEARKQRVQEESESSSRQAASATRQGTLAYSHFNPYEFSSLTFDVQETSNPYFVQGRRRTRHP
jgi:hypothetical protein